MRRNRRSALVAGAMITGLALTACSTDSVGGGGEEAPEELGAVGAMENFEAGTTFAATEPVTFSLLYRDHPNYAFQEDWDILQQLEENQNVTFDMVNVPLSDWNDRRNLLLAAGDAPDIVPSTYVADADQFVASGTLLPISEYLEHMPNFTAKVEEWGLTEDLDRTRQEDGSFYVLPGLLENPKPTYTIAIRQDLWEGAGLTEDPETWEEFADQLETIAETYPEIDYPYSDRWSMNGPIEATLQAAAGNFGTEAGWGYGDGVTWNGSEYEYTGAQDGYRDLIGYFADLVDRGLMDPESLTQDDDSAKAKLVNGQSAAIGSNDQEILGYRTALDDAGVEGAELRQIVVPAGPAGNRMDSSTGGRFESGIVFSSSAAQNDNFVAMLQFVDWLYYSDEGLEFAKWGVEGETYTTSGDGSRTLAENIDINGLNPGAPEALNTDYGYHNGVWMLAHGSTQDLLDSMLRPEVVDFRAAMNEKEVADPGPAILMDELEREQASLQQAALEDIVMQNTAAFILGQRPMAEWDDFVAELEGAGMNDYVELTNTAAGVE
ncbi:extracellular solute-binding protein [Ruania alkalisoli]|uniref:Extracellular solute-binding protein n=1 Tax=Ruania alkalisoli TaxID=2779775 RepID=A0A7M1SUY2_9MICO|nr:extracellular solute-binding protein [Ruania alkalisoli]QOR71389.1 extracellular solute-binding protein [Ruania alkalisoli]